MSSYGPDTYGGQADYGGTSAYRPTELEGIGKILKFLGLNPGDNDPDVWFPITGKDSLDKRIFAGAGAVFGVMGVAAELAAAPATYGLSLAAVPSTWKAAAENYHYYLYGDEGTSQPMGQTLRQSTVQAANDTGWMRPTLAGWNTNGVPISNDEYDLMAVAIWNYVTYAWYPYGGPTTQQMRVTLASIANLLQQHFASVGFPISGNPYFRAHGNFGSYIPEGFGQYDYAPNAGYPAVLDFSQMLRSDTLLSFLLRTQPGFAWDTVGPYEWGVEAGYVWAKDTVSEYWWYRCTLTSVEWEQKLESKFGVAGREFPGDDFVAYGASIPIAGSGDSATAMDGCVVQIDAIPPSQGQQANGHVTRYPYLGWLCFYSDLGVSDTIQRIELEQSVYLPKNMTRAGGVVWYVKPGTEGLLTPYDIIGV